MEPGKKLYVVGLGSSAGGLEALQTFIRNLGPDENTAYVVVQHLSTQRRSQLAHILGRETTLPVHEIRHGEKIKGGCIYVMPSGYKLRLEKGTFLLDERPETEIVNRAINYFFKSLASEMKANAFGIILSGTGTDGVEGVKEIERLQGTVIVQDPTTAQFDGMPENTIHKDHPDFVVAPELMPALIRELQEDRSSNSEQKRTYAS